MNFIYSMIEKGYIPDFALRLAILYLCKKRLCKEKKGTLEARNQGFQKLLTSLKNSQIAVKTEKANEQHYEVKSDFYKLVLGDHLKYSSCLWGEGTSTLSKAEANMLNLYCERAEIRDGMHILELGCGWGSLTLFLAERFPNSKILAVSNSNSQREFIMNAAKERNLKNVSIVTSDINQFETELTFDRVVSIEMFEHMRNYQELLKRISSWLKEDGKLFVHIFCNKELAYLFEEQGAANWMGRYFFSGGIMPSDHLLLYFQDDLVLNSHWHVNGTHYSKTAKTWHDNQVFRKDEVMDVLGKIYGADNKSLWYSRWKLFFLACEVLFAYKGGNEWFVSHYLFSKRRK